MIAASRTLGAGTGETFLRVAVPLARRGLAAGAGLAFARALGEFGATIMFAGNFPGRTQTLPLAIYAEYSAGNLSGALSLAGLLVAVSLGLLVGLKVFLRTARVDERVSWTAFSSSTSATA
jgi:molybdate transport system permease protein